MHGASLFCVITSLLSLTTFALAGSQQSEPPAPPVIQNSKQLKDSIYTKLQLPGGGACVRLLNRDGIIGCATPTSAPVTGLLVAATAATPASEIPTGAVAVVSPQDAGKFLQRCSIDNALQNTLAGVLILHSLRFPGWNEAPAAPYAAYAVHEMDRIYPWNPAGLDLGSIAFPFPIYQLDNETSANAVQRLEYNRQQTESSTGSGIEGDSTAVNIARMALTMEATGNSSTCIAAKTCIPLGGYSIWAALPPLPPPPLLTTTTSTSTTPAENTMPTLLVIAQIDSTSLFHSLTQAADSPLSGLIAMLTAAQILGSVENSPITLEKYKKRVIFLAVMGDTWDLMGSRRLLWEMENTSSSAQGFDIDSIEGIIEIGQVGRMKKFSSTPQKIFSKQRQADDGVSTFSISSSSPSSSTNLYQLFGHVEKSGVSGTAAAPLLAALQQIAAGGAGEAKLENLGSLASVNENSSNSTDDTSSTMVSNTTSTNTEYIVLLSNASSTTPGLTPCTASSFLRQRPEIPVVVLEEFDTAFINQAYHSQYDVVNTTNSDATSIETSSQEESFDQNGITATAIFLAQALNTLAQDSSSSFDTIQSNSSSNSTNVVPLQINSTAVAESVDALLGCLAKESPGMGCPLVTALMTPWTSGPAEHYIGILRTVSQNPSLPDPYVQTDVERFIWNFLAVSTATNITSSSSSLFPWCSPKNASTACSAGTVCAGWRDIQGSAGSGRCLNSTVKLVPSYSTLFECVGCNGTATNDGTFRWNVPGTDETAAVTAWAARYGWPEDPMWVESNWPMSTPSLELFLKESSAVDYAVLGAGLAVMVISVGVAVAVQLAWNKRMKQD